MKKAFTLVELLVVISIISMLASIVMVRISLAQASGRDAVRTQEVHQIDLATKLYVDTYKKTPALFVSGCDVVSANPTAAQASACLAVSTAGATGVNPEQAQHDNWLAFKAALDPFLKVPDDPCAGTCASGSSFPIGYTYVAPLAVQYYCSTSGTGCTASNESYQVYAPMERQSVPTGNEGSSSNYFSPVTSFYTLVPPHGLTADVSNYPIIHFVWYDNPDLDLVSSLTYEVYKVGSASPVVANPLVSGIYSYRVWDVTDSSSYWGDTFCYTVKAKATDPGSGVVISSDMSSQFCAEPPPLPPVYSVSVPTNLTVDSINPSNGRVTLSWTASVSTYPIQNGISLYEITTYRDGLLKNILTDPSSPATGLSYTAWGSPIPTVPTEICWSMRAKDVGGHWSPMSAQTCFIHP